MTFVATKAYVFTTSHIYEKSLRLRNTMRLMIGRKQVGVGAPVILRDTVGVCTGRYSNETGVLFKIIGLQHSQG